MSPPPAGTLDFALHRDRGVLAENLRRLAAAVGFEPGALHQATQVHGAAVVLASGEPDATLALEADALVAEPGTVHALHGPRAVGVRVADCVPLLIADPGTGRVAAVHAGWRGVEAGVVRAAIRHLEHLEASSNAGPGSGFLAAIGPCIGPCCFEVGADVGRRIAEVAGAEAIARAGAGDKVFVDLRAAVRAQLRSLGLEEASIEDVPGRGRDGCTRCDARRFYSYRRDGESSGRLLGVIVARGT